MHIQTVSYWLPILLQTRYIVKKVSLCGVQHSVMMADFIMPETQQPIIVIILIIYSPYLLKT